MHKPPATDYALGHRAAIALTTGALAAACIAWAQNAVSWLVPAFVLLVCTTAFAAKKRVAVYQRWRGDWDEMARPESLPAPSAAREPESEPAATPARERSQTPRQVLLVTWALLLYWLWTHQKQGATPLYGAGCLLFLALTALGVLVIALAGFRPARAQRQPLSALAPGRAPSPANDHVVSQCLPVSPEFLPDYVQPLLKRDEPPR
jgi:hypothetical protein